MLQIYNSLTGKKEPFKPLIDNQVSMYVCGMTVYDFCHIGHARTVTAFDIVARYLRVRGYKVKYVRNITDIDDKIIRRAQENNERIDQLTDRMSAAMREDFQHLGNQEPDQEPKATGHVDGMITMISDLIDKGFAYSPGNGDVYFRVRHFDSYGKLSGKVIEELEVGARVEIDKEKEDPLDFVLWKGAKPEEPSWPSPWGEGRPGWHIECSVMAKCHLGETFDIHGGGSDLIFPHHENEIAQSEAVNGKTFVNTWMHAGPIRIDNVKMSKSLGNFFTIREVLEKYHVEIVRYFLISSHYRSPVNYSEESLKEAGIRLERLYTSLNGLDIKSVDKPEDSAFERRFFQAMDDDFNTAVALAVLFDLVREINRVRSVNENSALPLAALLVSLGDILGILQNNPEAFLQGDGVDETWVQDMISQRVAAKKIKDFAGADRIRKELATKGIILEDSREGTTWRIER
ncbi:MAG: cysteine--tRNA ligase [Candidatus Endonucleobacter bathymodioli]|uniref:Cysteine--tRNA ligase n=1 Tax=Candidatus Endonucleibacter bathymodioli TaxID=539814 RepID=A0AA90SML3_9GAMM|nr:cysteine--tRNA ligase [Candidatus Endonucleobacter bathymodioli]